MGRVLFLKLYQELIAKPISSRWKASNDARLKN
jgi:hypothetical protein